MLIYIILILCKFLKEVSVKKFIRRVRACLATVEVLGPI